MNKKAIQGYITAIALALVAIALVERVPFLSDLVKGKK